MPSQMRFSPLGIKVCSFVFEIIIRRAIKNRTGKKGRNREKRRMDQAQNGKGKKFFTRRVPAQLGTGVVGIVILVFSAIFMVIMPVEGKEVFFVFA